MTRWVNKNNILNKFQVGVRKGYSVSDNILNLLSIINLKRQRKREKIYIFFVDFRVPFDSVDRGALYYKLYRYGISNKFMNILKGLHKHINSFVRHREGVLEIFECKVGLK